MPSTLLLLKHNITLSSSVKFQKNKNKGMRENALQTNPQQLNRIDPLLTNPLKYSSTLLIYFTGGLCILSIPLLTFFYLTDQGKSYRLGQTHHGASASEAAQTLPRCSPSPTQSLILLLLHQKTSQPYSVSQMSISSFRR